MKKNARIYYSIDDTRIFVTVRALRLEYRSTRPSTQREPFEVIEGKSEWYHRKERKRSEMKKLVTSHLEMLANGIFQ